MSNTEFEEGSSDTFDGVVASATRITPDDRAEVRQILLHVDMPVHYFQEGQSVGILVPGPHPFGNKNHHRYYTVASVTDNSGRAVLELLVRRCFYIDEVSGEEYPGIASNYLCDAQAGTRVSLTGPYNSPFRIPADRDSNLLMLGTGTGIAPFRTFLRRIYGEQQTPWNGRVRLFYGARNGADLLYMNDHNRDLTLYYDQATFQVIQAVSGGLLGDEADALKSGLADHAPEVWDLICSPKTHVYLAGMKKIEQAFEASMSELAGSAEQWQTIKQELIEARRWHELTYI